MFCNQIVRHDIKRNVLVDKPDAIFVTTMFLTGAWNSIADMYPCDSDYFPFRITLSNKTFSFVELKTNITVLPYVFVIIVKRLSRWFKKHVHSRIIQVWKCI